MPTNTQQKLSWKRVFGALSKQSAKRRPRRRGRRKPGRRRRSKVNFLFLASRGIFLRRIWSALLSVIVRIWNEFQLPSIFWVVRGRWGDLGFLLVYCLFCLLVSIFFWADFGSLLDLICLLVALVWLFLGYLGNRIAVPIVFIWSRFACPCCVLLSPVS